MENTIRTFPYEIGCTRRKLVNSRKRTRTGIYMVRMIANAAFSIDLSLGAKL